MPAPTTYKIIPLGNNAITIDYGNLIDEKINQRIISLFHFFQKQPIPGMIEAVPAYSSLTIYYDVFQVVKLAPPGKTGFQWMESCLEKKLEEFPEEYPATTGVIRIPVCYQSRFAPDIEELANKKNLSIDEVVRIHTSKVYRVYMLGFLPGFAYMGQVDDSIAMSRRAQPRQQVDAGSIGIAGRQTGVYPLESPGGWQIIGRTPVILFNAELAEPTLLKAGDNVQFYSISQDEFANY
jgi:inhibitor of KinA